MPDNLILIQKLFENRIATVNRIAKNNYPVSGTDHIIEKGTWIKVPVFAIHKNSTYHPDPDKFDPDRFESSEVKKRPAMTWLPFGDGPRGCIGMRFALMQIQIAIVVLLMNFEFSICSKTVDTIVFHPERALLSFNQGMYLILRPICK